MAWSPLLAKSPELQPAGALLGAPGLETVETTQSAQLLDLNTFQREEGK